MEERGYGYLAADQSGTHMKYPIQSNKSRQNFQDLMTNLDKKSHRGIAISERRWAMTKIVMYV